MCFWVQGQHQSSQHDIPARLQQRYRECERAAWREVPSQREGLSDWRGPKKCSGGLGRASASLRRTQGPARDPTSGTGQSGDWASQLGCGTPARSRGGKANTNKGSLKTNTQEKHWPKGRKAHSCSRAKNKSQRHTSHTNCVARSFLDATMTGPRAASHGLAFPRSPRDEGRSHVGEARWRHLPAAGLAPWMGVRPPRVPAHPRAAATPCSELRGPQPSVVWKFKMK